MRSAFLEQSVTTIVPGYDVYATIPYEVLYDRLAQPDADIVFGCKAFHDGALKLEEEQLIKIRAGKVVEPFPEVFCLKSEDASWGSEPGYLEYHFNSADGEPVFRTKKPLPFYSTYLSEGRKTFFTDNSYKFGSPPVIDQIAKFGAYFDGYPAITIDQERNLDESLILINPYKRPVVSTILPSNGEKSRRMKVPAMSARYFKLSQFLPEGEKNWLGEIQLTASNRLITFSVKHQHDDPTYIIAHEHLDPFRSDPTHMPATQWARNVVGDALKRRFQ